MNFLAHFYLSDSSPAAIWGSILGDFVKGTPDAAMPAPVAASIHLHRRIDGFTDRHPLVIDARSLFTAERRRYAGIILDMAFDHLLASRWHKYSAVPLTSYTKKIYCVLAQPPARLDVPRKLQEMLPSMMQQDWLASYQHEHNIEFALDRMAQRLRRREGLLGAGKDLRGLYPQLEPLFIRFFNDLEKFVEAENATSAFAQPHPSVK